MIAAAYDRFDGPIGLRELPDPRPPEGGVLVAVRATGLCRSDWHAWRGHDPDIVRFPHVPGHELAGEIAAVGAGVQGWNPGDRVTLPFVCGCGSCPQCLSGNQQVCDRQFQPGFTHWGSFAPYVAIHHARENLVRLPDALSFDTAAALGCRFVTAWRALVVQGRCRPGERVAVWGCGGLGLSAIMIAASFGALPVAIDRIPERLELASELGAVATVLAQPGNESAAAVREASAGGAHLSIDAVGSASTCYDSVNCLRKRGRHVQVGLMVGDYADAAVPMGRVMSWELELIGSHGMQAHAYPQLLDAVQAGRLNPGLLVKRRVDLAEGARLLGRMDADPTAGITVINRFG